MNVENRNNVMLSIYMKCPICREKFRFRINMNRHLRDEHGDWEAEKYMSSIKKGE